MHKTSLVSCAPCVALRPLATPLKRPGAHCWAVGAVLALGLIGLPGCTVLAVADLAASAVVGTAGLAVDAAVGTAKIGGKVIGKTVDVMTGSGDAPAPD